MSVVYKILPSKFAEGFMNGHSIRVGTLYDFRDEEKHIGGISDSSEGVAKSNIKSSKHLKGYERALFHNDIKSLGIFRGANVHLNMEHGSLILNHPNCFVFSSCTEEPNLKAFNSTLSGDENYDAVLRINNIKEFSELLALALQRGKVASGEYFGAPVQYVSSEWDYLKYGLKPPNPFEKNPIFANQQEHRVIFKAFSNSIIPSIADFSPFPKNLISRIK